MCLRTISSVGMNFSQNTLIDTKDIFQIVPQGNTSKGFPAFDFLVVPQSNNQLVRHSLLGEAGGFPGCL